MSKLDELMALASAMSTEAANLENGGSMPRYRKCRAALQDALKAVVEDAERYRLIAHSKAGTIRLDGDAADKSDYRWASPQYIHWGAELTLDAAIDAARKP